MSTNNLPTTQAPAPIQVGLTDSQSFELAQRVAKCFAMSTLVPKDYQNNLPNCVIALNMAGRMSADPMMVMQNLVVVHGRPSWSAQFLIATFNKSGKFSSIRYDFFGTEGQDDWGCRAKATELSTGELLIGPLVTIALAKKEGWFQKAGSKWQTMPEQMLRYRAAAWFVRTIAPEIAMGLQTTEEMRDTYDAEPVSNGVYAVRGEATTDLNALVDVAPASAPPAPTVVDVQPSESIQAPEPSEAQQEAEPAPATNGNGNGKKRLTQAELDEMRADIVTDIEAAGLDLKAVEKAVNEFSARWTATMMAQIEQVIIPNMLAESGGL